MLTVKGLAQFLQVANQNGFVKIETVNVACNNSSTDVGMAASPRSSELQVSNYSKYNRVFQIHSGKGLKPGPTTVIANAEYGRRKFCLLPAT